MEERSLTLIKWINRTFTAFTSEKMHSLKDLKDTSKLEQILIEIDEKFFGSMNLNIEKGNESYIYNMTCIYKTIAKFYNEIIGIQFELDFFNLKSESEENWRKLAELITGMSAQCDKRGLYLQVMQNMENEDSTELFTILTERISAYTEDMKMEDFKKGEEEDEDETSTLYIRLENMEIENSKLHDEVTILNGKISTLTKEKFTLELAVKETEGKYQELIHQCELRSTDHTRSDYEESVNMSIQLSELRGKLDAKEKNIQKLKEEKEKVSDDCKIKLFELQKENEALREKSIKYDVLKEKMHALDEVNSLKVKLIQCERLNKEQEDKIKKLKNFDVDKSILLKRIEELNSDLSAEKEKYVDLAKETNHYKNVIIQSESEIKFLKKQLEQFKSVNLDENNFDNKSSLSLSQIDQDASDKRYILELETKVKFLQTEKTDITTNQSQLEEKILNLEKEVETLKQEKEKFSKKYTKWTKYKEERLSYLNKTSELTDKIHELKSENENLKFSKAQDANELESNYKNQIMNLNSKHNEEIFSFKETVNKLENENNYLKKEIKKTEDLNESNKLYIEELQRKMRNPNSENKLMEIESKLKELATSENIELKRKINEKDESIVKLNDKIKIYDGKIKEYSSEIEKLKKISEEISIDEMKKKDEAIHYYKTQMETKEKLFTEEQQLVSSLFHQLALNFSMLQAKADDPPFNFNIENL